MLRISIPTAAPTAQWEGVTRRVAPATPNASTILPRLRIRSSGASFAQVLRASRETEPIRDSMNDIRDVIWVALNGNYDDQQRTRLRQDIERQPDPAQPSRWRQVQGKRAGSSQPPGDPLILRIFSKGTEVRVEAWTARAGLARALIEPLQSKLRRFLAKKGFYLGSFAALDAPPVEFREQDQVPDRAGDGPSGRMEWSRSYLRVIV